MAVIEYRTLNVRIEALYESRYKAVVQGRDGDAQAEFELDFGGRELDAVAAAVSRPRSARRRIESGESALARELGAQLFDVIFCGTTRDVLRASLSQARAHGEGLRLMLQLDGAPQLRNVPWELLWDSPRFISTSAYTPVLRYVDIPARPPPLSLQAPLRILGMVSSPGDMPPLDSERERTHLSEACRSLTDKGLLEIDWASEATLEGLLERLNEGDYHIFHFIGHGDFDEQAQDGVLLFEGHAGRSHRVTGVDLGTILGDQHRLRLSVINACEGARVALDSNGIAANLMQYGVPAVIAMQFEISDEAAIAFARHFYGSIARNRPIDEALADARRGMFAGGHGLEWATPVLFTSIDDCRLFDVDLEKLDLPKADLTPEVEEPTTAVASTGGRGLAPVESTSLQSGPSVQAGPRPEPGEQAPPTGRDRDGHRPRLSPRIVAATAAALVAITAAVVVLTGALSGRSGPVVGKAISVGRSPVGIAVGEGRVWVTSSNVGAVSWIEPGRSTTPPHVRVGNDPNSVAVQPNGHVWIANFKDDQVVAIDARSHKVVIRRAVGSQPNSIAIGFGAAWVTNSADSTISRIDFGSGAVHTFATGGAHPTGVAVGMGSVWVANSAAKTVTRIDPRANAVIRSIPVGRSVRAIAAGSGAVWVTDPEEDTVSRIDPRSEKVVGVIQVGHEPHGIAAAPSGIWVANFASGTVSRIDAHSNALVNRAIAIGPEPSAIAAGLGAIWVTNLYESTVVPIRP